MDIVRDKQFRSANEMLDSKLKTNLAQGLSRPTKHKPIINTGDLQLISAYMNQSSSNPVILRQKVWYNLAIHFVSRGLEFHEQLSRNSFNFLKDETGREYVTLTHETKEKTKQGGLQSEDSHTDKRMYATGTPSCPVDSLKFFLKKTDISAQSLFNQCNKDALMSPSLTTVWYNTIPVKHHAFTRFMSDISKKAVCSKVYTAHSLRATAIQALSDAGFELRHIMFMSGHKNESSVRSYSRDCSLEQKKCLSETLSSVVTPGVHMNRPRPTSENTHVRQSPTHSLVQSLSQTAVPVRTCLPSVTDSVSTSPPAEIEPSISISDRQISISSSNQMSASLLSNCTFSNCTFQISYHK